MQKNPEKARKEELQASKKELGRNENSEHQTKVGNLRLESEDDQGEGLDEEHHADGNHCRGNGKGQEDPDQGQVEDKGQEDPDEGQVEEEDPRRARLSGLSLTLGRGAVPRALRFLEIANYSDDIITIMAICNTVMEAIMLFP